MVVGDSCGGDFGIRRVADGMALGGGMEGDSRRGVRWWNVIRWLVVAGVVLGGGLLWTDYRRTYPYGYSHKCDKVVFSLLREYAEDHGGKFPDGAGRGEALSKLVPDYADVRLVCGKAVDTGEAEDFFEEHGVLSDALVSWGYRPGLTVDSYGGLALFWDPTGLGHNGDFRGKKWHTVIFVSGAQTRIAGDRWEDFWLKQEKLLGDHGLESARK